MAETLITLYETLFVDEDKQYWYDDMLLVNENTK